MSFLFIPAKRSLLAFCIICTLSFPSSAFAQSPPANSNSGDQKTTVQERQCLASSPQKLLEASFNFDKPSNRDFPIEISAEAFRPDASNDDKSLSNSNSSSLTQVARAPEGGPILLKLTRSSDSISLIDWQKSYLVGISLAGKSDKQAAPERLELTSMPVRVKDGQSIIVGLKLPQRIGRLFSEDWTIIPILCGGADNKLLGYGSTQITVFSTSAAWLFTILGVLVFWSVISYAAWQLNMPKLDALWGKYDGIFKQFRNQRFAEKLWKSLEAANPIFISQDSLGYGSLARFQILIFTTSVGMVLLYIFIHSGIISGISNEVLLLLGVTVVGGTLARATGDWLGISATSRQWLLGTEVLKPRTDKPRLSDLFETQGEIDVAKVQALLFTSLIAVGILASGVAGLNSFDLPEQIVWLSFVSQGTYVAGKLFPADSRKKVEEDLQALRSAAKEYVVKPGDIQAQKQFEMARETARRTLEQTYVNRFDVQKYREQTADPGLIA